MAALRRARRAAAGLALTLAALAACGGDDVPPVPEELRRLEQQEAGCIACHDGRKQPLLDPSVRGTPMDHPPTAILREMSPAERARLTAAR